MTLCFIHFTILWFEMYQTKLTFTQNFVNRKILESWRKTYLRLWREKWMERKCGCLNCKEKKKKGTTRVFSETAISIDCLSSIPYITVQCIFGSMVLVKCSGTNSESILFWKCIVPLCLILVPIFHVKTVLNKTTIYFRIFMKKIKKGKYFFFLKNPILLFNIFLFLYILQYFISSMYILLFTQNKKILI